MTRDRGWALPASSWPFMMRTVPGCGHSDRRDAVNMKAVRMHIMSYKLLYEHLSCGIVLQPHACMYQLTRAGTCRSHD